MNEQPPIFFYTTATSTNDLALSAPPEATVHGACWAADRQTAGRGRREVGGKRRAWFSPEHANLYLSILLAPDIDPSRASGLTLAAGAGICSTLRSLTDVDMWVKWPNDLYIGAKKVGGILSEARTGADGVEIVVVGAGINVNIEADQIPEELEDIMTSLQIEAGRSFDRLRLLPAVREVVVDYADRYAEEGFGAIIDELRAYDRTDGKKIRVRLNGDWIDGIARGIDDRGGLKVEVDGEVEHVEAGEVQFL